MSKNDKQQFDELFSQKVNEVRFTPPDALRDKVAADFARIHRRRRIVFWWIPGTGIATLLIAALLFFWPANNETMVNSEGQTQTELDAGEPIINTNSGSQNQQQEGQYPDQALVNGSEPSTAVEENSQALGMGSESNETEVSEGNVSKTAMNSGDKNSASSRLENEEVVIEKDYKSLDQAYVNDSKPSEDLSEKTRTAAIDGNATEPMLNVETPNTVVITSSDDGAETSVKSSSEKSRDGALDESGSTSPTNTTTVSTADSPLNRATAPLVIDSGLTESEDDPEKRSGMPIATETTRNDPPAPSMTLRPIPLTSASQRSLVSRESPWTIKPLSSLEVPNADCGKWIIGISTGAGISYRTLNSDVHHQLVDHKNSSEKATISTSAGINVIYTFLGKSGIKTGLTYLKVGERYDFDNGQASHNTINTYDYFNADLKFNQTMVCRSRFRLDVAAGAKFNLLNNAQSSWLDPNSFEATAHNNETSASPFREYNIVWSGDVTGYYFIGRSLFLGLTLEGDRFQNSVYKKEVGLEQKPYSFQAYLNLGVRF